jgi:hypothetical protein
MINGKITMKKANLRILVRNIIIEILVYGVLLVIYFFVVLQYLGDFLTNIFETRLFIYSLLGLGLIVAQAVVLEMVTSYLIRLLRLDRLG